MSYLCKQRKHRSVYCQHRWTIFISLESQMAKILMAHLRACLRVYVPIEWNFTLCMMLLTLSAADPTKPERWSHLLPFPAVICVCLDTAVSHDCNHCRFGFLTYDLAVALIFWQVYSLKWFVLVSSQSLQGKWWSSGAWDESWWDISCYNVTPNSPCIIFSIHSHSVQLMPSYLGRDFPSVYVETKFSAMWKCRGKNT